MDSNRAATEAEAGAVEVIEPWTPSPEPRIIEGRSLRAATYPGAEAVCFGDLLAPDHAAVLASLGVTRPMVDGSGTWAYPGDVARALRRVDRESHS